ncbi:hypothetical protein IWQ61_003123 [Dispira simplex]|nr:hypothetical protein IWQ61_003123 [Dispira simplex]
MTSPFLDVPTVSNTPTWDYTAEKMDRVLSDATTVDVSSAERSPVSPGKSELMDHILKYTEQFPLLLADESRQLEEQCRHLREDIEQLKTRLEKETRVVEGLKKLLAVQKNNHEVTWKTQTEIDLYENRILSYNKEISDKSYQLASAEREIQQHYLAVLRQQVVWQQDWAHRMYTAAQVTPSAVGKKAGHSSPAGTDDKLSPLATSVFPSPEIPKRAEPSSTKEEGGSPAGLNSVHQRTRVLQNRVQQLALELYQAQDELMNQQCNFKKLQRERDTMCRHIKALQQGLDTIYLYAQEPYTIPPEDIAYRETLDRLFNTRDRSSVLTAASGVPSRPISSIESNRSTPVSKCAIAQPLLNVSPNDIDTTIEDPQQFYTTSRQFLLRLYDAVTKCRNDVNDVEARLKSKVQYIKILRKFVDLHNLDVPGPPTQQQVARFSVMSAQSRTSIEEEIARDTHLFEWFSKRSTTGRPSRVADTSAARTTAAPQETTAAVPLTPKTSRPSMVASEAPIRIPEPTNDSPRTSSTFRQLRRQLSTVLRSNSPSEPRKPSERSLRKKSSASTSTNGGGGSWLFRQRSILSLSSHNSESQTNGPTGSQPSRAHKRHTMTSLVDQDSRSVRRIPSSSAASHHRGEGAQVEAKERDFMVRGLAQNQSMVNSATASAQASARITFHDVPPEEPNPGVTPLQAHPDFQAYDQHLAQRITQLENAVYERDTVISELSTQVHDLTLNLDHIQNRHLKVVRPIKTLFYQLPVFSSDTSFIPPRAVSEWVDQEQALQRENVTKYLEGPAILDSVATAANTASNSRTSLQRLSSSRHTSVEYGPVISSPRPAVDAHVHTTTTVGHRTSTTLTLSTVTTWNPAAVRAGTRQYLAPNDEVDQTVNMEQATMTTSKILDLTQLVLPDQLPRCMFSFAEFVERIDTMIRENGSLRNRLYQLEQVRKELDQVQDQLYRDREVLLIQREQLYEERDSLWQEKRTLLEKVAELESKVGDQRGEINGSGAVLEDDDDDGDRVEDMVTATEGSVGRTDQDSMMEDSSRSSMDYEHSAKKSSELQPEEETNEPEILPVELVVSPQVENDNDNDTFPVVDVSTPDVEPAQAVVANTLTASFVVEDDEEREPASIVRPPSVEVNVDTTGYVKPVVMDVSSSMFRRSSLPRDSRYLNLEEPVRRSPVRSSTVGTRKRSSTITPFLSFDQESRALRSSRSHKRPLYFAGTPQPFTRLGNTGHPTGLHLAPKVIHVDPVETSSNISTTDYSKPSSLSNSRGTLLERVGEIRYSEERLPEPPCSLKVDQPVHANRPISVCFGVQPSSPFAPLSALPFQRESTTLSPRHRNQGQGGKSNAARRYSDSCLFSSQQVSTVVRAARTGDATVIVYPRWAVVDSYQEDSTEPCVTSTESPHSEELEGKKVEEQQVPRGSSPTPSNRLPSTLLTTKLSIPESITSACMTPSELPLPIGNPPVGSGDLLQELVSQNELIQEWHHRLEEEARRLEDALRMMELEDCQEYENE